MTAPKLHQTAVKLSAAVYEPTKADVAEAMRNHGLPTSELLVIRGTGNLDERALVTIYQGVVYFIIRGTVNTVQWISNGNAFFRALPEFGTPGLKVHRGFNNGLKSLIDQALPMLHQFADMGYKCCLAGHSRGAGEATQAAAYLDREGIELVEIHLFGAPRTYNQTGAAAHDRLFGAITFRWIANNDIVCRVPFEWMGFRHVGVEFYFDAHDKIHTAASLLIKIRGQIRGRMEGGWLDGVSDHDYAKEYVRLVGDYEFKEAA